MRSPQVKTKSWIPAEGLIDRRQDRLSVPQSNEKFGLRLFLAVATSLFFLLIVSYNIRMGLGDWRALPNLKLLWLNTATLILSDLGFQWAKFSASRNQLNGVKFGLLGGGLFAWGFLIGQALLWNQLSSLGFYLKANPANSFFYLITAVHGLHLLGGLTAWGKTSVKLLRNNNVKQLHLSIELLTTYWHFLLAVWLVLFVMLLT
jgi:cytochrome c oxidase subunit 3